MLNLVNHKHTTWTLMYVCVLAVHGMLSHARLGCCATGSGSKKTCHSVPCPSFTLKDGQDGHVKLFPKVNVKPACLCCRTTNAYHTVKCRYVYGQKHTAGDLADIHKATCPSLSPRGGERVRKSTGHIKHTVHARLLIADVTIPLIQSHTVTRGKYSTVTVQVVLSFGWKRTRIHTNATCIINGIVSLIQHDIHDWNWSQPQWAACCCIQRKFVYPGTL